MSASVAGDLVRLLDEEAQLWERLLGLLREEEGALREGRGRLIADNLARKESLLLQIRLAEHARQALVRRLTGSAATPLRRLAGADPRLGRARERLGALLGEVGDASRRVGVLLGRALTRLDEALALLREEAGLSAGYTAQARMARPALPVLDGRA